MGSNRRASRWSDVGKMRVVMRDRGVKKVPGYSWIEVQNKVHTFWVGDSVHPEKDKIYALLEDLVRRLKKEGYVSKTKMVLHDVEEEVKEHMLKYHSEKKKSDGIWIIECTSMETNPSYQEPKGLRRLS
ncbi:hypothetical protein IFM89_019266 [Coptis chinensis]|uniref:Uncharacterized protein n=1 Tax=Coptis chinensis TaxID=261450 RepID=A0A835H775_9MAGN|nr:hypothetical protein IFM89_019266 [Coptis chinensis]